MGTCDALWKVIWACFDHIQADSFGELGRVGPAPEAMARGT